MLYSRSERRAVIALALMITVVLIIPRSYRFYHFRPGILTGDTALARQFAGLKSGPADNGLLQASDSTGRSLFFFDPNTATSHDWLRLGLSEKQAAVIERYKAKGGRFYKPEDLRKIYVLSDTIKDLLIPWVRISAQAITKAGASYMIEINAADSAAFEALYGIGPARSSRIVRFRKLLGGFYSVAQVAETYGLPDSIYRIIKPHLRVNPALINRIDLNDADYEVLRKHPYIHAKIAHAIIAFRNRNGPITDLEQLRSLRPINDSLFRRLAPYLKLGP